MQAQLKARPQLRVAVIAFTYSKITWTVTITLFLKTSINSSLSDFGIRTDGMVTCWSSGGGVGCLWHNWARLCDPLKERCRPGGRRQRLHPAVSWQWSLWSNWAAVGEVGCFDAITVVFFHHQYLVYVFVFAVSNNQKTDLRLLCGCGLREKCAIASFCQHDQIFILLVNFLQLRVACKICMSQSVRRASILEQDCNDAAKETKKKKSQHFYYSNATNLPLNKQELFNQITEAFYSHVVSD